MIEILLFAIWLELAGVGNKVRYNIRRNRKPVRWLLVVAYVCVALLVKGLGYV